MVDQSRRDMAAAAGAEKGWDVAKHDRLGRIWYGSPTPLKAAVGAGVLGSAGRCGRPGLGWGGAALRGQEMGDVHV